MQYDLVETRIIDLATSYRGRTSLVPAVVDALNVTRMAEVGVWRGEFSDLLLRSCPDLEHYVMVDPWRHLAQWDKPLNKKDAALERDYQTAMAATAHAVEKRHVMRGTTLEVAHEIPEGDLDFAYIDGDHTLRGVLIDLLKFYPKLRQGGVMWGDDFVQNIWQHGEAHEPTLVFPTAIYIAELMGDPIIALPDSQFAIIKTGGAGFALRDPFNLVSAPTVLAAARVKG
ncbi:class I SAM-dependent methyltransferase [Litoreibacter roseus]|nr:class I SAM-dependent methyltransferase [Litoreibacter roseus]